MDIFLLALLAIGALAWAWKNASAVEHLEEKQGYLRQKIDRLSSELKVLQDELALLKAAPRPSPESTPTPAPVELVQSQPVEIAKLQTSVQPAVTERRDLSSPRVTAPAPHPAPQPSSR